MRPNITCILCDNGEPLLARCIASLRGQTVKPEIIIASGPKTDLELARRLGDKVLDPIEGIGKARVNAILEAPSEYIISADSDCLYNRRYCEYALEDLQNYPCVKAGWIYPIEPNPLGYLESISSFLIPYEFALAFRKSTFLNAGIHLEDYSAPKMDICRPTLFKLYPHIDFRMVVFSRLPTKLVRTVAEYAPQIALASTPLLIAPGALMLSELSKHS
jgi:glycosyltransferase involved in cell wall biosynthesis